MSSSNNTLVIVSLGIGIVVIMGVGGLVAYSNVNNQLVNRNCFSVSSSKKS